MNSPSSRLVETVRPQLFVIVIVVTAGLFSCFGLVPKPEMLAAKLKTLFEQYGILLVAPISFAENLVGMNIYFPGSIVILTSMTLASGDPSRAVSTFLAIIIPSFLAHQLNFALGVRSGAKGHSPAFDSDAIATSNRRICQTKRIGRDSENLRLDVDDLDGIGRPGICRHVGRTMRHSALPRITATSSVRSIPTGHQVMHRPQPTQPETANWSCQVASLCVSHCR